LIAGGGIGGSAAALSLDRAGIELRVFEAVPEIWPLGVGIKILPHAVRELMQRGLTEKQEKIGIQTRELVYANRYVQQIG
jgi:2-polyprenyl-6-methoxyphenol hydroxylase-like FAD-dependent oxidoreductase